MITVEVMGGLGNQLFQIFTLIHTSMDKGIPFYFDSDSKPSRYDRPFYWHNFLKGLVSFIKKGHKSMLIYREPRFQYTPLPVIPEDKNVKLYGYFQSYRYFHENRESIFQMIHLTKTKETILSRFSEHFFQNTISLHFRIGDYKNLQHCHPVLPFEYYKMALQRLIEDTEKDSWKVLYFYEKQNTDEVKGHIETLKKQFPNLVFEGIDHDLEDWEQLTTMSLCQHNIIANSSFSWWGAYMNENVNKVYYPNIWFGPALADKNTCDLCLKEWNEITMN
jgi:hypothetical protein